MAEFDPNSAVEIDSFDPSSATPVDEEGAFSRAARIARDEDGGVMAAAGSLIASALPEKGSRWSDAAVDLTQGVVGLGQSIVGLGDLATAGALGDMMGKMGYSGKRSTEFLSGFYSDDRKREEADVEKAKGFWNTLGAMGENPATIVGSIIQSLPGTIGAGAVGGVAVRKLMEQGVARGLSGGALKEFVVANIGKVTASASVAEGAQSAGQIAEAGREAGRDWDQYALPAVGGGALTSVIGLASGKLTNSAVGKKLGLGDVETDIAMRQAGIGGAPTGVGGKAKRFVTEGFKEGVLEEMPQSFEEAVAQNIAEGKDDIFEGADKAAAKGLASGWGMGGGHALLTKASTPSDVLSAPTVDAAIEAAADVAGTDLNTAVSNLQQYDSTQRDIAATQSLLNGPVADLTRRNDAAIRSASDLAFNQSVAQTNDAAMAGVETTAGFDPASYKTGTGGLDSNVPIIGQEAQKSSSSLILPERQNEIDAYVEAQRKHANGLALSQYEAALLRNPPQTTSSIITPSNLQAGNGQAAIEAEKAKVAAMRKSAPTLEAEAAQQELNPAPITTQSNPTTPVPLRDVTAGNAPMTQQTIEAQENQPLGKVPTHVGGQNASLMSNEQLQAIIQDPKVHHNTRRAAQAVLGARFSQPRVETANTEFPDVGDSQPAQPQPVQKSAPFKTTEHRDAIELKSMLAQDGIDAEIQLETPNNGASKILNGMAKMLGKRIVFYSSSVQTAGAAVRNSKNDNRIWINVNDGISPVRLLGHETLHKLKQQSPKAYERLRRGISVMLDDEALIKHWRDYYGAEKNETDSEGKVVKKGRGDMTDDEIRAELKDQNLREKMVEEMLGDLAGNRFAEVEFWTQVFEKIEQQEGREAAKPIIAKLKEAILLAISKLKQLLKGGEFDVDQYVEHLDDVRDALSTAYAQYIQDIRTKGMDENAVVSEGEAQYGAAYSSNKRVSAEQKESTEGVIIGARPGEFDWTFSNGDTGNYIHEWRGPMAKGKTPSPIQHPTQMGPRIEKLGPAVEKILKSTGAKKLIEDTFGVTNLKVFPTLGQYKGKPEPSFALYGDGMTFEAADGIARMLGFAFAQESTIVTQPMVDGDGWPAFYVSNGKKLTVKEIEAGKEFAQKTGLDYSTSIDGTAFKFFFDGSDEEQFLSKVSGFAKAAGLKTINRVLTRSSFNEAKDYLGGTVGGAGRQVWHSEGTAGSSSLFGRTVDHLLVPYAKAVGAEGYRFSPDLFADRFGLTPQQREYIRDALRPKSGQARSTSKIVSGEEVIEPTKSDLRAKAPRSSNTDIMWALQNRAAQTGIIEPGDYSDHALKVISEAIADEVAFHISKPEGKSAIGWYDAALAKAKEIYDEVFPELRTNADSEMLFDAILGITSHGNDVYSNSTFAGRVYYLVSREGNTISQAVEKLYGTFGGETRAIENNLLKLEELIDRNGYDRMRQFMNRKMTVGEWNAILRRDESLYYNDKNLKVEGAARQIVNGWMVFGPKIGSFINNLHGDYSTLTADLWFSRTWNRILGFSFLHTPMQEAPKYQAFSEALLAEHTKTETPKSISKTGKAKAWEHGRDISFSDAEIDAIMADPDAMLKLATELEEKFRKGFDFDGKKKSGYSTKSDLRRAAKNWIEHRNDAVAVPRSDNERAFQQDAVNAAQKILKRKIKQDITVADIQAALWYHEKELFGMFGAGDVKAAPADYADAANNFMARFNDGDLFFVEKPSPRYILGEKGDYLDNTKTNSAEQGGSGDVQEGGAGSKLSTRRESKASYGQPRENSVSVTGIHYSKDKRTVVDSRYYGAGMAGEEAKRLALLPAEYRNRIYFYVNEGSGVTPESDVGNHAHSINLRNMYDAGSDPLYLSVNARGDSNRFERSVKETGFDGYYVPAGFGKQGVAVIIGNHSIQPEYHGTGYRGDDMTAPAKSEPNSYAKTVQSVVNNQSLPGGQMSGASWKRMMAKLMPEIDVSHLEDGKDYYRNQIVKAPAAQFSRTRTPEFKNWFGASTITDADGNAVPMYHGTARDITTFKPKQADAIFLTFDPVFAEGFADMSQDWMVRNFSDWMEPKQIEEAKAAAIKAIRKDNPPGRWRDENMREVENGYASNDYLNAEISKALPSNANIMPLYVRAENPFDFRNPEHIKQIEDALGPKWDGYEYMNGEQYETTFHIGDLERGVWNAIESDAVQKYIRANHDSFWVRENGTTNLAVFDPNQVKSASGNKGTYRRDTDDISFSTVRAINGEFDQDSFLAPEIEPWSSNTQLVDLAYINDKPIRLAVGTAKDFGALHLISNAMKDQRRPLDQVTDDDGENVVRTVLSAMSKQGAVLHKQSGDRYALRLPIAKKTLILDDRGDHYGITTLLPHAENKWGDAEWTGRLTFPVPADAPSAAPLSPATAESALGGLSGIGVYVSAKWNPTELFDKSQKLSMRVVPVTVKKKKTILLESTRRIIGDSGRQRTPEQLQAFKEVGREIDEKTTLEKIQEFLSRRWKQGIFDQFEPFRKLDKGAYTLMRLAKGATGAFEAFMKHGKLSIKDGAFDADTSGGVLKDVFIPLGKETTDFLYWVAANRAERLAMEGKERLFTPQSIAALKDLANGTTDFDYVLANGQVTRDRSLIYKDSLKKFNDYNKNVMDMAEKSGLIDGDSRHLWEHEFYVPFYRVMEDDESSIRGMNIKQGLVRQKAFEKLKGGEGKLGDLLSNTLMNWAHLIDASSKNRAAKAAVEAAERNGLAHKATPGEKKTVWFMDGGKKVEYKVTDLGVMDAISALEYAGMNNIAMRVLQVPKQWLTIGVTASPFFKVKNLIRDSMQVIATSDISYNAFSNVKEGWKLTDRDRQEYVSALAAGGLIRFGTMLEGNEAERTRQLIKQGSKDSHILDGEGALRRFYDAVLEPKIAAYNELGNRGEEINRMSLYNQLRKNGVSHAEAALQARDLMDFSLQGSWTSVRFLAQVVPFFNARMQGMYKLGRATKENRAHMATMLFTASMAGLALMAYAASDDDRWKKWKKREEWDKASYWYLSIGDMEFRIPKPFELGAVAHMSERSVEAMFDNEKDKWKRLGEAIVDLAANQLSMNITPQAFKPIVDIYANKDSFTKRPIESLSMQRLDPSERYTANTWLPARYASSAVGGALSPVQIEHLVRGYFSWLGAFSVGGADIITRGMSNEPAKPALDYWKFATGGMVQDDPTMSRYVSLVYDQAKELEQAHATYMRLKKEGRTEEAKEYREDNADKLQAYRSVESVKKQLSKINERIRMIERMPEDKMHPAEKRIKIRDLKARQSEIAERLSR